MTGLLLVGLRADTRIRPIDASLGKYKRKKRPLLLFTSSEDNPAYIRQKEMIQASAQGIAERDMVVVEMVGQDKVYVDGNLQKQRQSQALRQRFQVAPDAFAMVLVGKDGTEKYRSSAPVITDKIFSLIDRMPMRRQEMRQKDN